ncbi:MAG: T9SS type A sorting domain-containing protein [Flavobacteriales bacterium]|nr:T9SS type A sorting domain-containing protein [Flavobacteriales bacterium]
MTKTLCTTVLATAMLTTGLHAQSGRTATKQEKRFLPPGMIINPTRGSATLGAPREAFFSEDFSGGSIPAGWTNVDDLTPSGDDPVFFEWSNDPGAVEVASGSYANLVGTFNAPGASDGYIWANSDRGLGAAPATEHLTRLTMPSVDCSGQTSVMLTMTSTIGVFDNDASEFVKIRVSTDLETWQDFFPFPCLVAGSPVQPCSRFSDNPTDVMVDLTPAAAGQSTVYIQFEWQGGWEYYWAIDDVQLAPLPDNDLRMNLGFVSTIGDGTEYGRIPTSQLPASLNVGAELLNFGLTEHTNIEMSCEITNSSGGEVLTSVALIPSLTSQASIVTDENPAIDALSTGLYTAEFTVVSDQIALDMNPDDNTRLRTFEVTENLYALDNLGNHPEGLEVTSQTGSGSFENNTENVKLLTMYHLLTPTAVTGVQIALGSATDPGSRIVVSVLDTADVLATPPVVNNPVSGLESEFHVITQADIDAGVIGISFPGAVTLQPNAYYVVASLYADGEANVYIQDDLTVPQPALASALWIPFDTDNIFFYGGNGNAWAIRLSSDPTIGMIENSDLQGVSMYPNPTEGLLRITTSENVMHTMEVINLLGDVVHTERFGNTTVVDLEGLAHGVYTVRISDGSKSTAQRIALH